jgi:hypothetical protein
MVHAKPLCTMAACLVCVKRTLTHAATLGDACVPAGWRACWRHTTSFHKRLDAAIMMVGGASVHGLIPIPLRSWSLR